jgi:hypothetical protein
LVFFSKKSCNKSGAVRLFGGDREGIFARRECSFRTGAPENFTVVPIPHMARPRRLQEPVKLNLLLEKNHKAQAQQLAAERRMSISQLFVTWLLRDLDGTRPGDTRREDAAPDL